MLIGPRAASIPIQVVAVILGIAEGLLLYTTVVGASMLFLPAALSLPLLVLTVAACAYALAAPSTWRGLARRALLIVAVSMLGFAVLGYLIAFLLLRGSPIPGSVPSLPLPIQTVILALGVVALVGYLLLRDRRSREPIVSATVPTPEGAVSSGPSDTQG